MKSSEILRRLAGDETAQDIISRYRERYGRHASREIADRYGVSQRAAQRAMRGEVRNPKFARPANRAAAAMHQVTGMDAGTFHLSYNGEDQGSRSGPATHVAFGPGDLDKVIEALKQGDFEGAGEALDNAFLDEYGSMGGGDLTVEDYETGIDFDFG